MLCQFLGHNKVIQLFIYMYPFFLRFLSHRGCYRVLSSVPCAIQWRTQRFEKHVSQDKISEEKFDLTLSPM